MHDDQLTVGPDTVRQLLEEQFPQWAGLSVRQVETAATVNAIFRVGEELAARFPLRAQELDAARAWLNAEVDAARELAEIAPVQTPMPVAIGEPGAGYPLPWSLQTWVPGQDATVENPVGSRLFAYDLASFITSLRAADTRGRRFAGVGRGGGLTDHDQWMDVCFAESEGLLDVPRLRALWAELRGLPQVDEDVMCHGDLTPPNVLVERGRLVGVLDGGGYGPADPALDLVAAWHLLNGEQREILREALGCSGTQWRRGMAWAFQQAMGLVWYYARSNPIMSDCGRRTLDRILAECARQPGVG